MQGALHGPKFLSVTNKGDDREALPRELSTGLVLGCMVFQSSVGRQSDSFSRKYSSFPSRALSPDGFFIMAVFSLLLPIYIYSTPLFLNYVCFHMHVLTLAAVPGQRRTFEQGPAYIAYDFWSKLWTFSHPFPD